MAESFALSFNRRGPTASHSLSALSSIVRLARLPRVIALHAKGAESVNRSSRLAGIAAILIVLICLPLYARAHVSPSSPAQEQARAATVHGVVTDPTGAKIFGASVEFL